MPKRIWWFFSFSSSGSLVNKRKMQVEPLHACRTIDLQIGRVFGQQQQRHNNFYPHQIQFDCFRKWHWQSYHLAEAAWKSTIYNDSFVSFIFFLPVYLPLYIEFEARFKRNASEMRERPRKITNKQVLKHVSRNSREIQNWIKLFVHQQRNVWVPFRTFHNPQCVGAKAVAIQ